MIDISLETGPANEKVRQKLMIPFSFVISPGSSNANIQTFSEEVQLFPRCIKCGAYISKFCQKDESSSTWRCDICLHQNKISTQKENDNTSGKIFPEITSDDFQFVKKHQLGEEITVFYVSLNFHPKDFQIISTSIIDFLKHSNIKKPLLFLLGQKGHDFSILAPYKSKYFIDPERNNIITKIEKDLNETEKNEEIQTNDFPAPVFNFSTDQFLKEDVSKFIFSPDQYSTIIKTIERVSSIQKPPVPFSHFINSIETIRSSIQSNESPMINPLHFVSIIPSINDYFPSRFLKKTYDTLIRIDILTPTYNDEFQDAIQIIPGSISLFNSGNLVRNICKILLPPHLFKSSSENDNDNDKEFHSKFCGYGKRGQGTVYQWNALARSNGCRTLWRFSKIPYCYEEKGFAFSPVLPSTEQPIVLDIHPDGTSDFVNVQITSKMFMVVETDENESDSFYSSVFRVFNRKIKLSSDIQNIVHSINVNTLVWLWLTRTLEQPQREVLAALYRSTARIIQFLLNNKNKEDDQNQLKNNDDEGKQKIAQIVHSCCSLKFSDLMSQDEKQKNLSRYSLVLSPPSTFRLTPKFDQKNKVAVFGNTVFYDAVTKDSENDENSQKSDSVDKKSDTENHQQKIVVSAEVLDELMNILFIEKIETPIPEWCKSPDPQTLEFIHSLVSE